MTRFVTDNKFPKSVKARPRRCYYLRDPAAGSTARRNVNMCNR